MNWLLIFVPISIGLELLAPERYLLVFITSALAILPSGGVAGQQNNSRNEWARGWRTSTPRSATPLNS